MLISDAATSSEVCGSESKVNHDEDFQDLEWEKAACDPIIQSETQPKPVKMPSPPNLHPAPQEQPPC